MPGALLSARLWLALLLAGPPAWEVRAQDAAPACEGGLAAFRKTGAIRCGRLRWTLGPRIARRIRRPLELFERYDRLAAFLADLAGTESKAPFAMGISDLGPDFFDAASRAEAPLEPETARRLARRLLPSGGAARAYRWDAATDASWTDNLAVFAYAARGETEGADVPWYSSEHCRRVLLVPPPCEGLLRGVDAYAALEADPALAEYDRRGGDLRDLRAPVLTGMLVAVYRDFKARGRGPEFLDGLRKTIRFYHLAFPRPLPPGWADPRPAPAAIGRKAEVLVYLLSAFTQADLSGRFRRWGWTIQDSTAAALRELEAEDWPLRRIRELLEAMLRGAPDPARSAAQAERDAEQRAADDEQLGEGVSQQPARLSH